MATFELSEARIELIKSALQNYAIDMTGKAERLMGQSRLHPRLLLEIAAQADDLHKWFEGRDVPLPVTVAARVVTAAPARQDKPQGGLKVASAPRAPILPPSPAYAAYERMMQRAPTVPVFRDSAHPALNAARAPASGGNNDIDF